MLFRSNCGLSVFEHGERYHPADPEREGWVCARWMSPPEGGFDERRP